MATKSLQDYLAAEIDKAEDEWMLERKDDLISYLLPKAEEHAQSDKPHMVARRAFMAFYDLSSNEKDQKLEQWRSQQTDEEIVVERVTEKTVVENDAKEDTEMPLELKDIVNECEGWSVNDLSNLITSLTNVMNNKKKNAVPELEKEIKELEDKIKDLKKQKKEARKNKSMDLLFDLDEQVDEADERIREAGKELEQAKKDAEKMKEVYLINGQTFEWNGKGLKPKGMDEAMKACGIDPSSNEKDAKKERKDFLAKSKVA